MWNDPISGGCLTLTRRHNSSSMAASSTVLVSPCPSSTSPSASMVTRSAVSSASVVAPLFTSIPVNGTMAVASPTGSNMPVFTGAATKVGGSVGGLVVLLAAAFAL